MVGGWGEVGECGSGFGVAEELDLFVEEGFGDFGPDGPYETSMNDECFGGITRSRVVDLYVAYRMSSFTELEEYDR